MSDLAKNETTLANLPLDIVRLLIRQEGVEKVERLRVVSLFSLLLSNPTNNIFSEIFKINNRKITSQIARTWNAMVQEYLADRSTHRPIAAVR